MGHGAKVSILLEKGRKMTKALAKNPLRRFALGAQKLSDPRGSTGGPPKKCTKIGTPPMRRPMRRPIGLPIGLPIAKGSPHLHENSGKILEIAFFLDCFTIEKVRFPIGNRCFCFDSAFPGPPEREKAKTKRYYSRAFGRKKSASSFLLPKKRTFG